MTRNFILVAFIFLECGYTGCFEQGRFLWKDTNGKAADNGEKQIKPRRWVRSLYKWLHSPLINSVEELIEIDKGNSPPPVTQASKRFQRQYTEKFEEEFFLWQDGEGNPLKFGLKQIDESDRSPLEQEIPKRKESASFSSSWQNPLLYEDNDAIEDDSNDSNFLSLHESGKLNHLLKNKFEAILSFFVGKNKVRPTKSNESSNKKSNVVSLENTPKEHKVPSTEPENVSEEYNTEILQNNSNIQESNDQKIQNLNKSHIKAKGSRNYIKINRNKMTAFPGQGEVSVEKLEYQEAFMQPKFSELSFVENKETDMDWNESDIMNIDRSTDYPSLLEENNNQEQQSNRKLKRIRKHKSRPSFNNIQSHQFELFGTPISK